MRSATPFSVLPFGLLASGCGPSHGLRGSAALSWQGGSAFFWPAFLLCFLPASGAYLFWKAESAASAWAVDALLRFPSGRRAARFLHRRLRIDLCWQTAAAAGWVACFVGLTVLVFAFGRWFVSSPEDRAPLAEKDVVLFLALVSNLWLWLRLVWRHLP